MNYPLPPVSVPEPLHFGEWSQWDYPKAQTGTIERRYWASDAGHCSEKPRELS
jgi:hypothetical protein